MYPLRKEIKHLQYAVLPVNTVRKFRELRLDLGENLPADAHEPRHGTDGAKVGTIHQRHPGVVADRHHRHRKPGNPLRLLRVHRSGDRLVGRQQRLHRGPFPGNVLIEKNQPVAIALQKPRSNIIPSGLHVAVSIHNRQDVRDAFFLQQIAGVEQRIKKLRALQPPI